VAIVDVQGDTTAADVGIERDIQATVRVGRLAPEDVTVQLAHGLVGANNELTNPTLSVMTPDYCEEGTCTYSGRFVTDSAGLYGFSVRVVPSHADLTNPMDLGRVTWAAH
jgi:starch phosphorylase